VAALAQEVQFSPATKEAANFMSPTLFFPCFRADLCRPLSGPSAKALHAMGQNPDGAFNRCF
jgi:hypothetical protein